MYRNDRVFFLYCVESLCPGFVGIVGQDGHLSPWLKPNSGLEMKAFVCSFDLESVSYLIQVEKQYIHHSNLQSIMNESCMIASA